MTGFPKWRGGGDLNKKDVVVVVIVVVDNDDDDDDDDDDQTKLSIRRINDRLPRARSSFLLKRQFPD